MLKWIGKVAGGSDEPPKQAPAPWIAQLERLIEPVAQLPDGQGRPGLAQDLLNYVVLGEPAGACTEVQRLEQVGAALQISNTLQFAPIPGELYRDFAQVPAAAALRWAQLLAASAGKSAVQFEMVFPGGTHWPEALLLHGCGVGVYTASTVKPAEGRLSMEDMERVLAEAGLPPQTLLVSAFSAPPDSFQSQRERLRMARLLRGYAEAVTRHAAALRPLLLTPPADQQRHAVSMLQGMPAAVLAGFLPQLAELAASPQKDTRLAAEPVLRSTGMAAVPALKEVAERGKPEQRFQALRLLHALAGEHGDTALPGWLRDTAAADKSSAVQSLLAEWEGAAARAAEPPVRFDYQVPVIDWRVPLTPALEALLRDAWQRMNRAVEDGNRRREEYLAQHGPQDGPYWKADPPYTEAEFTGLCSYLDSDAAVPATPLHHDRHPGAHLHGVTPRLAIAPEVGPVALFKFLAWLGLATDRRQGGGLGHRVIEHYNSMHRVSGRPSLLELSLLLEAHGGNPERLIHEYGGFNHLADDWPAEAVWPYFAHHIDALERILRQNLQGEYRYNRDDLFRAVAWLPQPPPSLADLLYDVALGSGKTDRRAAQDALERLPGKEARIVAALADGRAEVRMVAAQWLGRLRHAPAQAALEAATLKEKNDLAKGAQLDALEALGQPLERFLDRKAYAAEAAKGVAKGLPKELDWFPWSALPALHWADNGEALPADTIKWLMAQAVRQKSSEPNAVLRRFCSMFEPRGREALGQFVLEAWLGEDVRSIPLEQAQQLAAGEAQQIWQWMQRSPQHFQDSPLLGRSVAELTATFLPRHQRKPVGSATASRGLLAVAAACAGGGAAAPVARYLKEWYGTRAPQGKALIAMLAWIEHPSATQLMLSIGSRFRTRGFQEEATRQAGALAERKGWTLAELADRTIPSAGFDEQGQLELSYGNRVFNARLLADFKIELCGPEGRKIAALPEPRQDDDAELAAEAKKAYSAAKKELKKIVELQGDRLYEALCLERDWALADWELYLNRHPVMRHLLQRLVWIGKHEGQVRTFRPLDDGSLTDCEDNPVTLPPETRVRLAHGSLLAPEEAAQWQRHLADYKVTPLFQQFGRGGYALPEGRGNDTGLGDFEGYLIESFKLRGRALKLGYVRGPTEDGGWFRVYEKRFISLGLSATIEFTGSPMPEENRTVALIGLSFSPGGESTWDRPALPLSRVPKVLLSECYEDLRAIAGEGSGFDPGWREKAHY